MVASTIAHPSAGMPPRLEVAGLSRTFGTLRALQDVDLAIAPGEAHALLGENGAGKSTLIRIISGAERPTGGVVRIDGQEAVLSEPSAAVRRGIRTIHQHPTLIEQLSVEDNLALPRPPVRRGLIDRVAVRRQAEAALAILGLDLDPATPVARLRVDLRQRVEIARALARGAGLLILDEPTAVLSDEETAALLQTLRGVTEQGVSLLYVTHRLEEIAQLCDRVSVLRSGRMVATLPADAPVTDLAAAVTGRPFAGLYPAIRPQAPAGQATTRPLLVAEGLAVPGILAPTTVEVRAGEVVGVEGGTPTTRSALLRALVGGIPQAQGRVQIGECTIRPGQVQEAIRAGVGYVPADRQGAGLVPQASAADNLWYGVLTRGRTGPNGPSRTEQIAVVRERLAIAAPSMDDPVARLSGGNQQKVVVGRWVAARSQVLVLDEPTRGVDVGAREVIYQVVAEIVAGGGAVVLASSDRQEMDALCTRTISVPAQEPGALMGSGAELRSSP